MVEIKVLDSKMCSEIFVRFLLFFTWIVIGLFEPVERKIQPEELWQYRYPITNSYCTVPCLWCVIVFSYLIVIITNYRYQNDKNDLQASFFGITLSLGLTAVITRLLKLATGKPRPDFYWRCFPNGYGNNEMNCTGNYKKIREGRLSFPSGHSSLAFSGLGFISLYLMGKLQVSKFKGQSWRIIVCLIPGVTATLIGISRTCDYHHHPMDVLAGCILGTFMTTISYHYYYPPFYKQSCDVPYTIETKELQE